MRKAIILLFTGFLLAGCEKEESEDELLFGSLRFGELVTLIGRDTSYVRANAPGLYSGQTVELGEPVFSYKLCPDNINMEATLLFLFTFYENSLREIGFVAYDRCDEMELAYNLSICSQNDPWGSSKRNTLYYDAGYDNRVEFFSSPGELWDFVKSEDLSQYDIKLASVERSGGGHLLSLYYMGEYEDKFLGNIE